MTNLLKSIHSRVDLQPVQPADEAFLLAVYASTRAQELATVNWSDQERQRFLQMQFQAQSKHYREHYPGAAFHIIQVDGQPAGRLYTHRRAAEIRIMDIALLPRFRNRGIGTLLLKQVLEEGECSAKTVTIHVEGFNPARHWYERLGFKKIALNGPYQLMQWSPANTAFAFPMTTTNAESQR